MKVNKTQKSAAAAAALAITLGLASCGTTPAHSDADVTLRYWLWDSSQMPGYRQCAENFQDQNPEIFISLEQYGWDDYWTQLTASMVAENAPDVFTNHTSRFGKYGSLNQLLDLEPYIERDGYDLEQFQPGLAEQWKAESGEAQLGIPKDWDTVAMFYNEDMVEEAGYSPQDLWELEWNPQDGGTYEQFLAAMTVDVNGVRGNEPGFDKDHVAVYGVGYNDAGSGYGQVQWSTFALSNGWEYADKNPWGRVFNYDDPAFQESIEWWRSLIDKGYMPKLSIATSGIGTLESLAAGAYATLLEGSWNMSTVATKTKVPVDVAPTPIGPVGHRASLMNGLADSVWVGTEHPEESWKWVSYMGSTECQDIIAEQAVVFPAISSSSEKAMPAFEGLGFDPRAFSTHLEDGTTVSSPVVDRWAELDSIMNPAMAAVISGQSDASSLTTANKQVNEMMARNRD